MKNQKKNTGKRSTQIKTAMTVLRYIGKYRFSLLLSLIFSVAAVSFTLWIPVLVGDGIDLMVSEGVDFNDLFVVLVKIAISAAVVGILQWIMNTVNNHMTYRVIHDVRRDAFAHIQRLPLSTLDSRPTGEFVSRVISDVDQFADGLLMGFTQLFSGILTIVGTLVFMLTISWKITLVVVMITPVSLFVAKFIAKRTYSMFLRQSEARGKQTAYIDEMIGNARVVRAFNHEAEVISEFDRGNEELRQCSLRAIFFSSTTNPTTRFVNSIVYAAVGLTGALAAVATQGTVGAFTVGNLTSFLAYANQYTKPFNEISGVIAELQNALACAARVFELIEEKTEKPDDDYAHVLETASGRIVFDNVSFSYTPDKKLLENINLNIKSGQKVAIVGPTGCGKTTLINLLMRFYEVNSGAILFDGADIRDITRKSLRSQIGMVLQETWLKSGTIRENIALGKPNATEDEIISAAKAAHAHSFIKRLPYGYDTVIGEDEDSLSQGQKQLLCIARLMLCRPPMLILDEATSSTDTRTEAKIQKAFHSLMEGRTSFIVAHRLSTVRDADIILVMKDGNIIEQGTHEELLSLGGFYSELYESQFAH